MICRLVQSKDSVHVQREVESPVCIQGAVDVRVTMNTYQQMDMIQQMVQMHSLIGVRPVLNVNVTLLEVKWIVGHVKDTGCVEVSAKRPQDSTVTPDVDAEVTCVRNIVEIVRTV